MARKYNLGDSFKEGDPGHPQTHSALGAAVNDLDDRTVDIETDLTTRLSPAELSRTIAPIAPTFAPWMGIGPGKVFTRLYIAEG